MHAPHLLPTIATVSSDGSPFLSFANADGKRWVMPEQDMGVAMQLYQPSGLKGKLLKWLFPYLYRIKAVQHAVRAERMRLTLTPAFKAQLETHFGTEPLAFAIFCGTPCVHQKFTIQISRGRQILGYAKVSDNAEVVGLFEREADTMRYLATRCVMHVPQCLFCGTLTEGIGVFIQSTTKTIHATTDHHWSSRTSNFLKTIYTQTKQLLPFEQTDFYADLHYLSSHFHSFSAQDQTLLKHAVEQQFTLCGSNVCYGFYHGDFTPWNTYIERGVLYAFDLEYARRTYPPYLDYWHFYTQTAIFAQGRSAADILLHYKVDAQACGLFAPHDIATSYTAYLLAIIAHYTHRERGRFEGDIVRSMALWLDLLRMLLGQNAV